MKLAVFDAQGFQTPEFWVKELTIFDGHTLIHKLFKPSVGFQDLCEPYKKCVRHLEQHHHMLKYSSEGESQEKAKEILKTYVREKTVDIIYVKGFIKEKFLRNALEEFCPQLINLECVPDGPKLLRDIPCCKNHYNKLAKCMCSLTNAYKLFEYLCKKLHQ